MKRFYQTKDFWLDTGERTVMTFLEVLLGILAAGLFFTLPVALLATVLGTATASAFIKCVLAASKVGPDSTISEASLAQLGEK